MNEVGYELLKARYSKPIEDDSLGLAKFIQKMYLHRLEEKHQIDKIGDSIIESMSPSGKNLAFIVKVTDCMSFGGWSGHIRPDPHYEESIEIAHHIAGLKKFIFSPTPYFNVNGYTVENKSMTLIKTNRGEMTDLNEEELNFAKESIERNLKFGYNVIHQILGLHERSDFNTIDSSEMRTRLIYSCCAVPKKYLNKRGQK